jgi:hypothetical protein
VEAPIPPLTSALVEIARLEAEGHVKSSNHVGSCWRSRGFEILFLIPPTLASRSDTVTPTETLSL